MSFASRTSLGDVAKLYQIALVDAEFVVPSPRPVSDVLREDLLFSQKYFTAGGSEAAVGEGLIYPVLKEVWKPYANELRLWSHEPLSYDDDLSGTPDYFVARMSPLGPYVKDTPYLMIVEGKRDDASRGWAQCLAAMLAAQKLNERPDVTLFGITTTGRYWEFGKLESSTCTRDPRVYLLAKLDELCAALHFVFDRCRQQVSRHPSAA